jgi:hypothetical protein
VFKGINFAGPDVHGTDWFRMRQIPDGWTNANLAMHDKFAVRLKEEPPTILNGSRESVIIRMVKGYPNHTRNSYSKSLSLRRIVKGRYLRAILLYYGW